MEIIFYSRSKTLESKKILRDYREILFKCVQVEISPGHTHILSLAIFLPSFRLIVATCINNLNVTHAQRDLRLRRKPLATLSYDHWDLRLKDFSLHEEAAPFPSSVWFKLPAKGIHECPCLHPVDQNFQIIKKPSYMINDYQIIQQHARVLTDSNWWYPRSPVRVCETICLFNLNFIIRSS